MLKSRPISKTTFFNLKRDLGYRISSLADLSQHSKRS